MHSETKSNPAVEQDAYTNQIVIPSDRTVTVDIEGDKKQFSHPHQLRNVQPFIRLNEGCDGRYMPSRIWPMPSYLEILDPQGKAICRILEGSIDFASGVVTAKPEAVQFFEV